MRKFKKMLFIITALLVLIFTLQKTTNFFIEKRINSYFSPYQISARLQKLDRLTLQYKNFTLTCKIKIEDKVISLVPENRGIISKLLPNKISIPLN